MIHVGSLVIPTSPWFWVGAVAALVVAVRLRRVAARRSAHKASVDGPGEATSLYRFFDQHGELLYVGVTARGDRRFAEHARSKPWWPFVHKAIVEHYPTRAEALAAERTAIECESPLFNIAGRPPSHVHPA